MKKEGSLKLILAILIIILICLVSLGGIFVKDKNIFKNILTEYKIGMDLETRAIVKLDVQKDEESSSEKTQENSVPNESSSVDGNDETHQNEANGNSEGESNVNADVETDANKDANAESETNSETNSGKEDNTQENSSEGQDGQANNDNLYTLDNYKKSKEIIEKRLKLAGVDQYYIRLDEQSGSIVIEFDNNVSSYVIDNLNSIGKTEVKIAETGDIICGKDGITKFTTNIDDSYVSAGIGKIVTLRIEFSKDAINKFKELKDNYVIPTNDEGTPTENKIEIAIDGISMYSNNELEFLESAVNGSLELAFGEYTTDEETIEQSLEYVNARKMLIETEDLKLKYTDAYEQAVHSNISKFGIMCVFATILGIMCIYLLLKYKVKGLLAGINILGFGALLLFVLRYTGVQISISTIVAIIGMLILQFIYVTKLLSNNKISSKTFSDKTLEFSKMLIPGLIISVVTAIIPALGNSIIAPFGNTLDISIFGMVIFWGLILFEIFNNILTRAILTNVKSK